MNKEYIGWRAYIISESDAPGTRVYLGKMLGTHFAHEGEKLSKDTLFEDKLSLFSALGKCGNDEWAKATIVGVSKKKQLKTQLTFAPLGTTIIREGKLNLTSELIDLGFRVGDTVSIKRIKGVPRTLGDLIKEKLGERGQDIFPYLPQI